jgi:hypothetical protein
MPGSAPASLRQLADRVTGRLDEFLAAERDRWAAFDPELAQPIDEIRRLVLSATGAMSALVALPMIRSISTRALPSS